MLTRFEMLAGHRMTTGRLLVCLHKDAPSADCVRLLNEMVKQHKVKLASATDRSLPTFEQAAHQSRSILLPALGIAIMQPDDAASANAMIEDLSAADFTTFSRPETYLFADDEQWQERYARWVREGLHLLADHCGDTDLIDHPFRPDPDVRPPGDGGQEPPSDEDIALTWGIRATGAHTSALDGEGISVCVLDTGVALDHPDLSGRVVMTSSFVEGEDVQDRHGHGTHCLGTVGAADGNSEVPRYGVARRVDLLVGKVLDNGGSGPESWTLAGLDWALGNRTDVISLSLGRSAVGETGSDPIYESIGEMALAQGCLIVAAAGNGSARPGIVGPISSPANASSIMAVAAIDEQLRTAGFSNGETAGGPGRIDIAGPGVNILSAAPLPRLFRVLSGTSMATPHVAGIAALFAQSDPNLRGTALRDALVDAAKPLQAGSQDIGAGLVFAPQ